MVLPIIYFLVVQECVNNECRTILHWVKTPITLQTYQPDILFPIARAEAREKYAAC